MIVNTEKVIEVHHYTDKLFTFKTTRNPSFKFENGQFTMIGIKELGIMRAYSIANSNYEDYLNFISINVPDGLFTSELQKIRVGDEILVSTKVVGTLTLDRLTPADNLYLLATGTGLAPFLAIIADPATYEKFERVHLVHSCRVKAELLYSNYIKNLHNDELLGDIVGNKLQYHPRTTQEFPCHPRIIKNGECDYPFNIEYDRVMLCGNPDMLNDLTKYFEERDWLLGSMNTPGDFIIEKAFVDRG